MKKRERGGGRKRRERQWGRRKVERWGEGGRESVFAYKKGLHFDNGSSPNRKLSSVQLGPVWQGCSCNNVDDDDNVDGDGDCSGGRG